MSQVERMVINGYSVIKGEKCSSQGLISQSVWNKYWAGQSIRFRRVIKTSIPKLTKNARHFDIATPQTLISVKASNISKIIGTNDNYTVDFAAGDRGYYEMLHIVRSGLPYYVEFAWFGYDGLMSAIVNLTDVWNAAPYSDMTKRGNGENANKMRLPFWGYPEKEGFHPHCHRVKVNGTEYNYPRFRWKPFAQWGSHVSNHWIKEPSKFNPNW